MPMHVPKHVMQYHFQDEIYVQLLLQNIILVYLLLYDKYNHRGWRMCASSFHPNVYDTEISEQQEDDTGIESNIKNEDNNNSNNSSKINSMNNSNRGNEVR